MITLDNIRQYPDKNLLVFFLATTDIERQRIIEIWPDVRTNTFTIIDTEKSDYLVLKYTLLQIAIVLGKTDHVEFLLKKYHSKSAVSDDDILLAAKYGHKDLMFSLYHCYANKLLKDTYRRNDNFYKVISCGNTDLIEYMVQHPPLFRARGDISDYVADLSAYQMLKAAIQTGKTDVVKYVITKWKVQLEHKVQLKHTAIIIMTDCISICMQHGNAEILAMLGQFKAFASIELQLQTIPVPYYPIHLYIKDIDESSRAQLENNFVSLLLKLHPMCWLEVFSHNPADYKLILRRMPIDSNKAYSCLSKSILSCDIQLVTEIYAKLPQAYIWSRAESLSLIEDLYLAVSWRLNARNLRHRQQYCLRGGLLSGKYITNTLAGTDFNAFEFIDEIINKLLKINVDIKLAMANSYNFSTFRTLSPCMRSLCNIVRYIVQSGHVEILKNFLASMDIDGNFEERLFRFFYNHDKDSWPSLIKLFDDAILSGSKDMVQYFIHLYTKYNYDPYSNVSHVILHSTLDIYDLFLSMIKISSESNQGHHYYSMQYAFMYRLGLNIPNDPIIIKILRTVPSLCSYALMHHNEFYELYTKPFLQEIITTVMDSGKMVSGIEVPIYMEIILFLIQDRNNTLSNNTVIKKLLTIPAVFANADYKSNLLLRMALQYDLTDTALILLLQPTVYELAKRDQFYRRVEISEINLNEIVANSESATRPLTPREEEEVRYVTEKYSQKIHDMGGVDVAFQQLKDTLNKRYRDDPIKFTQKNNKLIRLPLTWNEFEALHLDIEDKNNALKAYYKNQLHTAIRYLSEPNRWLNVDAKFCPQDRQCANFYQNLPLIVTTWHAANDKTIQLQGDYADWEFNDRITYWLTGIAAAGRTHNYDQNSRIVYDYNNQTDDLDADRPTCLAGSRRRVYEILIFYPFPNAETGNRLRILDETKYRLELSGFVRKFFIEKINFSNLIQIKNDVIDNVDNGILSIFNMSNSEKIAFIQSLAHEYTFESIINFIEPLTKRFANASHVKEFNREFNECMDNFFSNNLDPLIRSMNTYADQCSKKSNLYKKINQVIQLIQNNKANFFNVDSENSRATQEQAVSACKLALEELCAEAATQHYFGELPLIIRAFIGVFAILTVLPAIAVIRYSSHGLYTTFFGRYESEPKRKCMEFQQTFDSFAQPESMC